MDLTTIKLISLFGLLCITLIAGILPLCIISRRSTSAANTGRRSRIINYFNCFAGGVFMAALFLELMTEGAEEFEDFKKNVEFDSGYPFYNAIVILGFFMTALIEYFTHSALSNQSQSLPKVAPISQNVESNGLHNDSAVNRGYGTMPSSDNANPHSQSTDCCETKFTSTELCRHSSATHSHLVSEVLGGREVTPEGNRVASTTLSSNAIFNVSRIRSMLLLFALSFHSVFDGLALGLQSSSSNIWEIFFAVALHKCIVSFCLGLDLFFNLSNPKMAAMWMIMFSSISPVGVAIGILITSSSINDTARLLSSAILQGLACGTFLYVTFLEILNTAWKDCRHRSFLEVFLVFFGFALMAGAKAFDD